jgi:hypothetical protein
MQQSIQQGACKATHCTAGMQSACLLAKCKGWVRHSSLRGYNQQGNHHHPQQVQTCHQRMSHPTPRTTHDRHVARVCRNGVQAGYIISNTMIYTRAPRIARICMQQEHKLHQRRRQPGHDARAPPCLLTMHSRSKRGAKDAKTSLIAASCGAQEASCCGWRCTWA